MEKARIMIVEDEAITAMEMSEELEGLQYEVCKPVSSGEKAIKSVEQEKPDIVLMDIILNGKMNGIEAAREIHSRYGIPIIFITSCMDEGTRKLAEDVGPVGYFIKPIDIEALTLVIDKALLKNLHVIF